MEAVSARTSPWREFRDGKAIRNQGNKANERRSCDSREVFHLGRLAHQPIARWA
jgi:hypothetical protein